MVAYACVGRASMPVGFRLRSRMRSTVRPSRHRLLMHVLRLTPSSLAECIVHSDLHIQACACIQSNCMSRDNGMMLSAPRDMNSPAWLVVYVALPMSLVEMSCTHCILVNNIHNQAAVVSWKMCDIRNPYRRKELNQDIVNKMNTCRSVKEKGRKKRDIKLVKGWMINQPVESCSELSKSRATSAAASELERFLCSCAHNICKIWRMRRRDGCFQERESPPVKRGSLLSRRRSGAKNISEQARIG